MRRANQARRRGRRVFPSTPNVFREENLRRRACPVATDADDAGDPGGRASGSSWDVPICFLLPRRRRRRRKEPRSPGAAPARARHHARSSSRSALAAPNARDDRARSPRVRVPTRTNVLVRALSDRAGRRTCATSPRRRRRRGLVAASSSARAAARPCRRGADHTAVLSNRPGRCSAARPGSSDLCLLARTLAAPALMSLTRSLCAGDGKYDQFVACASPAGRRRTARPARWRTAPSRSPRRGSRSPPAASPAVAAVVAMRVEPGERRAPRRPRSRPAEKGRGARISPRGRAPGAVEGEENGRRARGRRRAAPEFPGGFIPAAAGLGVPCSPASLARSRPWRRGGGGDARGTRARLALLRGPTRTGARALVCGARGSVGAAGAAPARRQNSPPPRRSARTRPRAAGPPRIRFFRRRRTVRRRAPGGTQPLREDPGRVRASRRRAAAVSAASERARASSSPSASLELVLGQLAGTRGGSGPLSGRVVRAVRGIFGSVRVRQCVRRRQKPTPGRRVPPERRGKRDLASETRRTPQPRCGPCATPRPRWRRWSWTRRLRRRVGAGPAGGFLAGLGRTTGGSGRRGAGRGSAKLAARGADPGARTRGRPRCLWRGRGAAGAGGRRGVSLMRS